MKKNKKELLENRFRLLIEDHERFFEYSKKPLRKSIRINTLKTTIRELVSTMEDQNFALKPIPWVGEGVWVEGRGLSETIEYFLGHYYIQESSSMIPTKALQLLEDDFVLDVAAAPGGKTTHIAALMKNNGCVIANEVDPRRRAALKFNLSKYGVLNTAVTSMDFSKEINCKKRFTRILLDAPCSCEGQFRKNPLSLEQWSLNKILRCSRLQKKMILNALNLLEENGFLVYSTCTLAPEENEEVIDFALKNNDSIRIEPLPLRGRKFNFRLGVTGWNDKTYSPEVEKCVRVYPQDNDSEGFFMAKIVKCGR